MDRNIKLHPIQETEKEIMSIPKEFDLQGVKLATLLQAVAYKGIREGTQVALRQATRGTWS